MEGERETSVHGGLSRTPWAGTEPTAWACAPTWNRTRNPPGHRTTLQPTGPHWPGHRQQHFIFSCGRLVRYYTCVPHLYPCTRLVGARAGAATAETVWRFRGKPRTVLPYDPFWRQKQSPQESPSLFGNTSWPWSGGSVGWGVIPRAKRLWVRFPVRCVREATDRCPFPRSQPTSLPLPFFLLSL